MRDDFTQATKERLAKRVGNICSFPGCGLSTIGPGHEDSYAVINLGEAAHINAASENGPRYKSTMSSEERKAIDNGIWMCRQHARLVDADKTEYSDETLRKWKQIAEESAHRRLVNLERINSTDSILTLVALGPDIVFSGIWKGAVDRQWIFMIRSFVRGDINLLREYNDERRSKYKQYMVVETQGDGRLLTEKIKWEFKDGSYEVTLHIDLKTERTTPYHLCDMDANMTVENGDIKLLRGVDCAKQEIALTLSTDFGELWYAENFGSNFSSYYWEYKDDIALLNKLLRLEIVRLLSIPYYDSSAKTAKPPLNYINKVIEVTLLSTELKKNKVMVRLKLEWGDGKEWEDVMEVYVRDKEKVGKKALDMIEDWGMDEWLVSKLRDELRSSNNEIDF